MFYREHHDRLAEVLKANAVVTGPKPELGRFDILAPLDIAFAGGKIASQTMQNVECCSSIDSAKVGFGLVSPSNLLPHR
jgi:hypothetical protein